MQTGLLKKAPTVKSLATEHGVSIDYINQLLAEGMSIETSKRGAIDSLDGLRLRVLQNINSNPLFYKPTLSANGIGHLSTRDNGGGTTFWPVFEKGGDLNAKLSSTPAGGALVSQINGKEVVHNDGSMGGIFKGRRHSESGIKAVVDGSSPVEIENEEADIIPAAVNQPGQVELDGKKMSVKQALSTINTEAGGVPIKKQGGAVQKDPAQQSQGGAGEPVRLQGSSVIITRDAVLDDKKREYNGEMLTNRQILSKINVAGGGAAFEDGGEVPTEIMCHGGQFCYGGKTMGADDMINEMNHSCGCQHSSPIMEQGGPVGKPTKQSVLKELENIKLEGILAVFNDKPWRMLKFIQEQATGMSGPKSEVGMNAYESITRAIGGDEGLVQRCIIVMPDHKKEAILEYLSGKDAPTGLFDALRGHSSFEKGGTADVKDRIKPLKDDYLFLVGLKRGIEKNGTAGNGWDINLFKSSFYNKVNNLFKQGRGQELAEIFNHIETATAQYGTGKIFTDNHKIWALKPKDGETHFLKGGKVPDIFVPVLKKDYPDRGLRASDISPTLKAFLPTSQYQAIMGNEEIWEVIDRLEQIVTNMPGPGKTSSVSGDDQIVYLHYFVGGSDWYIVERDKIPGPQNYTFGYAILNGDFEMSEWGGISIEELKTLRFMNLDFYFTPVRFREIRRKLEKQYNGAEQEEEQEKPPAKETIKPRPGTFLYGQDYDVPAQYSQALITELRQRGFSITKMNGSSMDVIKDGGHKFYIKDIASEFEMVDVKTNERICYIYYISINKIVPPAKLADRISQEYNNFYKTAQHGSEQKQPTGTFSMNVDIDEEVVKMIKEQAANMTMDQFNFWFADHFLLKNKDYDLSDIKEILGVPDNADILQIYNAAKGVSAAADEPNLMAKYQNAKQSVKNSAIRALLQEKGADRSKYSADDLAFIKLYEGAGGLAKQGETGTGLFDQFFTPMEICGKMWGFAFKYGFKFQGAHICEPAVGSGRLLQFIPKDSGADVVAYDIDETAYLLCKVLFPDFDIRHGSFEQMFFKGRRHIGLAGVTDFFDLVITNPPYRDYISEWSPLGEKEATGASTFEMYFITRGIDILKPGGLLIMLIPNSFLSNDNKYNDFKNKLIQKADFLDAYRLPNGVFGNTEVGTDILVMRKK